MRRDRTAAAALLFFTVGACSVDRRKLSTDGTDTDRDVGESSQGSASAQAGASDAPASTAGTGGATGSGSSRLVDGCADLDTDGVADCKTTLVLNPAFNENVDDWTAPADTTLTWSDRNALDDTPSGSAELTTTSERASAEQCVEVAGHLLVIAYASAYVDDQAQIGRAVLRISFFENSDCSGQAAAYFDTPPSTIANAWTTIQAGGVSLPETASVSLALVGLKPDGAAAIDVYFDNVMLKTKEL